LALIFEEEPLKELVEFYVIEVNGRDYGDYRYLELVALKSGYSLTFFL